MSTSTSNSTSSLNDHAIPRILSDALRRIGLTEAEHRSFNEALFKHIRSAHEKADENQDKHATTQECRMAALLDILDTRSDGIRESSYATIRDHLKTIVTKMPSTDHALRILAGMSSSQDAKRLPARTTTFGIAAEMISCADRSFFMGEKETRQVRDAAFDFTAATQGSIMDAAFERGDCATMTRCIDTAVAEFLLLAASELYSRDQLRFKTALRPHFHRLEREHGKQPKIAAMFDSLAA